MVVRPAWHLLLLILVPLGAPAAEGSLFARVAGEPIPFPLDALLERITAPLAEGREGLRIVLIPLGRSLQRHAAGHAHYFEAPRVVVAVTGEPAATDAPLLKDRLYLGYHETAGVLEVISYDEGAGRFAFEIVDDYREGAAPQLRAANRGLCLACHQNGAPIFSRPTWDETAANPRIAQLLAATGRDFYGLPWRHGVDVPNAIDEATERANLLDMAQTVWREGCAGAAPCRAQLLWLTLRARLSGRAAGGTLADHPELAPLLAHWRTQWPDGLPLPDPDIPNRQPFAATLPWQRLPEDATALRRLADVAAPFDPLALRAPLAHWRAEAPDTLARVIHALGQFVSDTDVTAIDRALRERPAPRHTVALPCTHQRRAAYLALDCADEAGRRLQGRLAGDTLVADRLVLDARSRYAGLRLAVRGTRALPASPRPRSGDGLALDAVALSPDQATLTLADDLDPLRRTIDALSADDALGEASLRRAAVLGPLLAALGLAAPPPTPARPALAARAAGPRADDPALAPFYRHCGLCHDTPDAFPPGFLHGDTAQVRERIDACAPRMLRRLAMWDAAPAARQKTPMPPPASVQAGEIRRNGELARMRGWLRERVAARGLDDTAPAYADLPECTILPE